MNNKICLDKKDIVLTIFFHFFNLQDFSYLLGGLCISNMDLDPHKKYIISLRENYNGKVIIAFYFKDYLDDISNLYADFIGVSLSYEYHNEYTDLLNSMCLMLKTVDSIATRICNRTNMSEEEVIEYCINYTIIG